MIPHPTSVKGEEECKAEEQEEQERPKKVCVKCNSVLRLICTKQEGERDERG